MKEKLKRQTNIQCAALLIYKMIMNVVVMGFGVVMAVIFAMDAFHNSADVAETMAALAENLPRILNEYSGWGYLLAILVGILVLLIWKKPSFFFRQILKKGRPMGAGTFCTVLCLFMGAQLVSQLGVTIMSILMSYLGKDLAAFLESSAMNTDSFTMWLYAGLGAPVFEEILFRGLLMRSMEPYGKRLSILVSALLFGFYHGNPVQAPYAALVGMVLGYVAMEHNIIWAMVLHMFNNLIFADVFPRVLSGLPEMTSNLLMFAAMMVFAAAAVVLLIVKRRQVMDAIWKDPIMPWQYNGAFLSPVLLILVGTCVVDMVLFVGMIMIS